MRKILTTLAILIAASPSMAATNALKPFAIGGSIASFFNDETIGWKFTTADTIQVTALGWWVHPGANLISSHQVGVWSSTGALLGNSIVTAGARTAGTWRFAATLPFTLTPGEYFIGGRDTASDGDGYMITFGTIPTASGIGYISAASSANNSGFAFPGDLSPAVVGRFGPNFQFSSANSVPEPSSWAMLIAGFGLIGAAARRRRSAVAG